MTDHDLELGKNETPEEAKPEQAEKQAVESGVETEQNALAGARMLKNPPEGSFVSGLRAFVAWAKSLLDDQP